MLNKQLFLDLITLMLGWSLYLLIIPKTAFVSRERVLVENLWLFDIFNIEIFIKYPLDVLAISISSWDRILSSSTIVIFERSFNFSNFQFNYFPKGSIICHLDDVKISIEILFIFSKETSNIVTLLAICFSINITFCVKKFVCWTRSFHDFYT